MTGIVQSEKVLSNAFTTRRDMEGINNESRRVFKELDMVDFIMLILLALIPIIVYGNVLKQGYISLFDFTLPTKWMRIYPGNLQGYVAGLNYYNSISGANFSSSFRILEIVLINLFGPYGLRLAAIIPQMLLGPFAYFFSRYFMYDKRVSFVLSLFVMFNPFVMMLNFDSLLDIFSYIFIMPFIISYIELRIKKNLRAGPFALLFLLLPSIYGSTLLLYLGIIISFELSLLITSASNLKYYLRKLITPLVIIVAYVFINIGDLLNIGKLLASSGAVAKNLEATFNVQPSHFNFIQIITFRAEFPYENGLTIFFPAHISSILVIAFLILFITAVSFFVLRFILMSLTKNKYVLTLLIFTALFFIYSVGILSESSDYFYINTLISLLFPIVNPTKLVDPWYNGIYMVIFYSLLIIFVAMPLEQERISSKFLSKNRVSKSLNWISNKNVRRAYLSIILSILVVISAFYIVSSIGLNNSHGIDKIPESDIIAYNILKNTSSGFILTVPTTYAISFNYTKEYANAFGTGLSPTDATFWWNFAPGMLYQSGSFYTDILDSLYHGSNVSSYNEFNNLATLSGIEYILNLNPSTITGVWGSPPPVSNSYILNHTDFRPIYESSDASIFKNPYYRGVSYTSNIFLVSSNPINETILESKLNLSLPVVPPSEFQNLLSFRHVTGITFNETTHNKLKHNTYLLKLRQDGYRIESNASNVSEVVKTSNYQEVHTIIFQNGTIGLLLNQPLNDGEYSIIVSTINNYSLSGKSKFYSLSVVDGLESIILTSKQLTYLYESQSIIISNLIYLIGLVLVSLTCVFVLILQVREIRKEF